MDIAEEFEKAKLLVLLLLLNKSEDTSIRLLDQLDKLKKAVIESE